MRVFFKKLNASILQSFFIKEAWSFSDCFRNPMSQIFIFCFFYPMQRLLEQQRFVYIHKKPKNNGFRFRFFKPKPKPRDWVEYFECERSIYVRAFNLCASVQSKRGYATPNLNWFRVGDHLVRITTITFVSLSKALNTQSKIT